VNTEPRRGLVARLGLTETQAVALVWFVWIAVVVRLIADHEVWRDELQGWSIVREARFPWEVLGDLWRESHPPLWYFVAWPFSVVSRDVWMMKFVNVVIVGAAGWVTLRYLPARLLVRIAIVCSYYPLYELGVLSRSYGLLYLLTAVTLFLYSRSRRIDPPVIAALVAIASTHLLGSVVVLALVAGFLVDARRRGVERRPVSPATLWGSAAVLLAAIAIGFLFSRRLTIDPTSGLRIESLGLMREHIVRTFVPLVDSGQRFWGTNVVIDAGPGLVTVVALVVAAGFLAFSWRSPAAFTVVVVGFGAFLVAAGARADLVGERQLSVLALIGFACVWLVGLERRDGTLRPVSRPATLAIARTGAATLAVVVALGVVSGLRIARAELANDFSAAPAAAAWMLEWSSGEPVVLCALHVPVCSSVAMSADVPYYTSAKGAPKRFVKWGQPQSAWADVPDIPSAAAELAARTGKEVFVVASPVQEPSTCKPVRAFLNASLEFVTFCSTG
jgi:hypothetical protein